jgi:hypothetical protein
MKRAFLIILIVNACGCSSASNLPDANCPATTLAHAEGIIAEVRQDFDDALTRGEISFGEDGIFEFFAFADGLSESLTNWQESTNGAFFQRSFFASRAALGSPRDFIVDIGTVERLIDIAYGQSFTVEAYGQVFCIQPITIPFLGERRRYYLEFLSFSPTEMGFIGAVEIGSL